MTTTVTTTFLELADSPLVRRPLPEAEYTDVVVRLATTAAPDAGTIRALLSITRQPAADRIADGLQERDDLPPSTLAMLIADRPNLTAATTRLKAHLFPASTGCHRFTRAMATLAHHTTQLDTEFADFLRTDRFTRAAATVDPAALHDLLEPVLSASSLPSSAQTALAALRTARTQHGCPTTPLDLATETALQRARLADITAPLQDRREQVLTALAEHTAGLTRAAGNWYDALTAAASTPELIQQAEMLADQAVSRLSAREALECPWPAVRERWHQVTATARTIGSHADGWQRAWLAAAATADGSRWDPVQRPLVAAYDLLTAHVHATYDRHQTPPTPAECWATDPVGRTLLHTVADHLTGDHGHSPLDPFDDALLISFIQGLSKNRRDRAPGALHIVGLVAAIKAARAKAHLTDRPNAPRLGIVIPMRGEAHRLDPTESNQGTLTTKLAQLSWYLAAHPEARAHVLLVDEDPDRASSCAAQTACDTVTADPHIQLTVAARQ